MQQDYRDKSYWLAAADYSERPPLMDVVDCDVAIIGGGLTGLASAYHLKRKDPSLRIVVLEAQVVGFGASGRNAGHVLPVEGWELAAHLLTMPRAKVKQLCDYSLDCVSRARELIESEHIDCDAEWVGLLELAHRPLQLKLIEHEVRWYEKLGHTQVQLLDRRAVGRYLDSPWFIGGRRDPSTGIVDPAKLVRGLAQVVRRLGVTIFERSPVIELIPGAEVELIASGGRVQAKQVIVATNAFGLAQSLAPRLGQPLVPQQVVPLFTYIILTEPLEAAQLDRLGWPGREALVDKRVLLHYLRLTADNRLLIGGRDAVYYRHNSVVGHDRHQAVFQGLRRGLSDMFPALGNVSISHQWGGPVAMTSELMPAIGRHPAQSNILYGLGYSGHGVAQALGAGRILRDLVLERDSELLSLPFVGRRLAPIPAEPLRYPVLQGLRGVLRLLDAALDGRL